jgi:hypothetical protein
MDSTGKLLLGGALGAALGYLLSQKNPDTGQEAVQASATVAVAPTPAEPVVEAAPTEPVSEAPPTEPEAPPSEAEPVAAALPAEPLMPVFEVEVPAAPEETDIVLTREFLEQPLPGSGWRSLPPLVIEEATVETEEPHFPIVEIEPLGPEAVQAPVATEPAPELVLPAEQVMEEFAAELPVEQDVVELPVVEEFTNLPVIEETATSAIGPGTPGTEALAHAADVAGRLPAAEALSLDDSLRVDDLRSRIEETRRRIRHELEQPFDLSAPVKPLERDWATIPVMPVFTPTPASESVESTPVPVQPLVMEPTIEEPAVVEAVPMEVVEIDAPPVETVATEAVAAEPPVASPLAAEPLVAEPIVMEPLESAPPVMDPAEVAPVAAVSVASTPVAAEPSAPEPIDYDSMKSRIENTRSRLKAKAFDAMMAGEAALLGRDEQGAARASTKVEEVDSDLDQTIETSLSQEEE